MTIHSYIHRATVRRVIFVSTLLLVAVGLWVGLTRYRHAREMDLQSEAASSSTALDKGMHGMSDMAHMDMSSDGTIALTSAQIRSFGITFGTADVRLLVPGIQTTGVIVVDETQVVQVTPKVRGIAEQLFVNFTGQSVRRGTPLLELYAPELVAAEQELLLAHQLQREMGSSAIPGQSSDPVSLVAAAKRRLQLWDISDAQIDEIVRTGRVRRTLTLMSPTTGVVLQKLVVQGQAVTPEMPLYIIANLSHVWVEASLREIDAGAVRIGSEADVEIAAYPGQRFKGRVTYIDPIVDTTTRTIRARLTVANTAGLLKPGMYATVRLSTPTRRALTVPSTAVLQTGTRNIVFVDLGHNTLMPRTVEIGHTAGDLTEILSGLEPGQRVVTSAQFLLDSESNVGDVMKAMMSQMGTSDMGNMDMGTMKKDSMHDMPGMTMPNRK